MHYMRAWFTSLYYVHFCIYISHSGISEYDKEKSVFLLLTNQLGFFGLFKHSHYCEMLILAFFFD